MYSVTKEPISQTQVKIKEDAIRRVVPDFDKLETMRIAVETETVQNIFKKEQGADSLTVYKAIRNGEWVGTAMETFSDKGFGGRITLIVGFLPDGNIYKIEVLNHTETPGLGDKMEVGKSKFPEQFLGKNPKSFSLIVKKDGGEVDAITAATISSRAYCDAVQTAYNIFEKEFINDNDGGESDE
ncbi:MAG: RnfABCDGE type electron transport complex subunit G [Lentimicrobiaceae bacterium]|nr:RnfABCDGE type electron transport complex subunit G [Lentimicrobiaceae bacterium]